MALSPKRPRRPRQHMSTESIPGVNNGTPNCPTMSCSWYFELLLSIHIIWEYIILMSENGKRNKVRIKADMSSNPSVVEPYTLCFLYNIPGKIGVSCIPLSFTKQKHTHTNNQLKGRDPQASLHFSQRLIRCYLTRVIVYSIGAICVFYSSVTPVSFGPVEPVYNPISV